ncbi:MAG TPA: MarP family serine protease [Streptosporangiaceae bacterium]
MPGDLLDLILIALAAAFAVAGYRQGFIIGALGLAGFLGGAAVGAIFSPQIARAVADGTPQQALVAIVVVFLAAVSGQLIASMIGTAMSSRLTWRPAALADAAGGALVSVVSVLLIAWFIGSAVASAPFPSVARQVNRSAVLKWVDTMMPQAAHTMFSDFRQLLARGPYTQVFGALGAEGALSVRPPSSSVLDSPALTRDRRSIVKITGNASYCRESLEGSGFVYARGYVLTNAHVVAAVTEGPSVSLDGGATLPAQVVLFDPQRDVAVLRVPALRARPLSFNFHASTGDNAIVAGFPQNHPFTAVPARIGGELQANAPNIYSTVYVTRDIYSLRAQVRPGNSGGPLLAPNGDVYGIVFAASVDSPNTGYALTANEVIRDARLGAQRTKTASTQPRNC